MNSVSNSSTTEVAENLFKKTEDLENEKKAKQFARLRRATKKKIAQKKAKLEKLVAPAILILTILLGLFVQFLYK